MEELFTAAVPEYIQVIARIRPLMKREEAVNKNAVVFAHGAQSLITVRDPADESIEGKQYSLDAVYGPEATQEDIFQRPADIVDSVLQGGNGTIIALGQTGSGKTFTLRGVDWQEDLMGVSSRAARRIFNHISNHSGDGTYSVKMSYLNIYNENITDFLISADERRQQRVGNAESLRMKETPIDGVYVEGLTWEEIHSIEEFEMTHTRGMRNVMIEQTLMSSASNRMHNICSIIVECRLGHGKDARVTSGRLTIVDMAGSEGPVKKDFSGINSYALKEAANINKSLNGFVSVICALTDKVKRHVPYRESRLTRLLQDSLGGHTRTLVIATLNPTDHVESIHTIRMASRMRNIVNTPKGRPHIDKQEPIDMMESNANTTEILADCTPEIESLKQRVALLETIVSVCVPDEALVKKLEASAVWNNDKKEFSIPVYYAAKIMSNVHQADIVDVCGSNGVCDEDTDWIVIEGRDNVV